MQDEVNEKTIALYIKTGKLTAQTLQKAMKAILSKGKKQLATNVFIPYALLRSYARFCQTSAKEKRCNPQKKITTLSKPYSILTDTSYLPSVSTSAISFAVALTIRMPVSLIPSRSASSCRRCVFFSGGVSKRNWSTDIL